MQSKLYADFNMKQTKQNKIKSKQKTKQKRFVGDDYWDQMYKTLQSVKAGLAPSATILVMFSSGGTST